jgi:hypothetical protein
MTNRLKHIENRSNLDPEILQIISHSKIVWNKTKDEIWMEMQEKIEDNSLKTGKARMISFQVFKLAAAVIFFISGISAILFYYTKKVENPVSQQTVTYLPDHSKTIIYANSSLSYKPLIWKFYRTIKFNGEGLFEVQKGKKFTVLSKKAKTEVLGTQFLIYSRNNDYNVTCYSGKVKVTEFSHQHEVNITGGQKAILKPDGNFEIVEIRNTRPENSEQSKNQIIDEQLNDLMITSPAQTESEIQQDSESSNQQPIKEPDISEEIQAENQKEIDKSQNFPDRITEEIHEKEQIKSIAPEQTGKNEQKQNQYQENEGGQSAVTQQNQNKFRASLTPDQVSILENKQMSNEEKRNAFMQSLSSEQRILLNEQNKERAQQVEKNKNESANEESIKEQQKLQLRRQSEGSTGKETRMQQRQQNLTNPEDNNTNRESGSDNGASDGTNNNSGKGN